MPKVNLPRASWEQILLILEDYRQQGYLVSALVEELSEQVYSQEY